MHAALPPSLHRQASTEALVNELVSGAAGAWDPTGEDRQARIEAAAFVEAEGVTALSAHQLAMLRQWKRTAEESTFVFVISAVSSLGGLLFGYCVAIVSGVLYMDEFTAHMGIGDGSGNLSTLCVLKKALVTTIFAVAAAVGSAPCTGGAIADCIGRRYTTVIGAALVGAGGLVVAASGFCPDQMAALVIMYVGRALSGLAIGVICAAVPLYQSEIAPAKWRGSLTTFFQLSITIGILTVTTINYRLLAVQRAWQYVFALQSIPALLLAVGMALLPESPRWLLLRKRPDEAERSLRQLRHADRSDAVYAEFVEMKRQIEIGGHAGGHAKSAERCCAMAKNAELRRIALIVCTLMALQQLIGVNVVLYYGPSFLNTSGDASMLQSALELQALYGFVNFVGTLVPIATVDCIGRRALLIGGALIMAICLGSNTLLYGLHGKAGAGQWPGRILLLFVFVFAATWGPVAWLVCAEVFPTRSRASGLALAGATNWTFNIFISLFALFAISPTTAPLLPGITVASLWPTFLFFTIMCVVALFFTICCVRETRGMDHEQGIQVFGRRQSIGSIGSVGAVGIGSIGSTPRERGGTDGASGERVHIAGLQSARTRSGADVAPTSASTPPPAGAELKGARVSPPASRLASASAPLLDRRSEASLRARSLDDAHWSDGHCAASAGGGPGRGINGSPRSQRAARCAIAPARRACCTPRARPRSCCRKYWLLRNLTHAVVATDVFAVALLLMSVSTDTAQGELLFTSVSSESLFPIMLVVNYILLISFYTRDWWLLIVLWKGFLALCGAVTCAHGMQRAFVGAGALGWLGAIEPAAVGVYAAFTLLFAALFTRSRRFKQQWRRHLPAKIFPRFTRQHIDDGFIAFDEFDVFEDQCIGSGGEARVFRGEWAQIDVAVRRIFLGPVSQVERDRRFLQFKSEVRLMKQLVHPSIASFFGCSLHRSHFYMILELGSCSMRDAVVYHQQHGRGSSLAERLSGSLLDFSGGAGGARSDDGDAAPSPPPPRLELRIALRWALEVAEGMLYVVSFSQCGVSIAYLHEKKSIAHLDLKPENILLRSTERDGASRGIFSQRSGEQRVAGDAGDGDGAGDGESEFARPAFDPARTYAVRICDFGLAQRIVPLRATSLALTRGGNGGENGGGTPFYMPPEAIIAAWGGVEQRAAAAVSRGSRVRGSASASGSVAAPPVASLAASSSSSGRDSRPSDAIRSGTLSVVSPRSTRDAVLATATATVDASPPASRSRSRSRSPGERVVARESSAMERSMSADVYAFGIVLWELVTCDELYPDARGLGFFLDRVAVAGERPPTPGRELCDEATAALMARCWATRLEERPCFFDIVQELHAIICNAF